MKKIAAIVMAFALGAALGMLGSLSRTPHRASVSFNKIQTGIVVPVLTINVYDKSGALIYTYTKVGDLPTKNFLKWLMNTWWYSSSSIQLTNQSWTAEDGTSGSPGSGNYHAGAQATVAGVSSISLKVALGNGTATPTIDDYALENKLDEAPVTWYCFDANSTHMWIEVKATYTATSPINITEIGLLGYMNYGITTSTKWFLLFRDVVSQITLDTDQTLEVRYYIYVRYG